MAEDSPVKSLGGTPAPPVKIEHRGGTRVQVGTPINVGGDKPWMCAVKLMGRAEHDDDEPTQTLLLRTGRGNSPQEAQRNALAQMTHVYGRPDAPLPQPVITKKPSDPPPPPPPENRGPSWLRRIASLLGRGSPRG
jgi:hypothetical protein